MSSPARPGPLSQFLADFDILQPDPVFAAQEERGICDWKGGNVPFVPAGGNLPFVDIPRKLQELIEHCWKAASRSANTQRGPLQIGGGARAAQHNARQGFSPSWGVSEIIENRRYNDRNAPYVKQVAPLSSSGFVSAHLASMDTDWKPHEQLERVNAYTFRGDKRTPTAIIAANGFQPPITRTDQYYVDNVIYRQFNGYMERRFNTSVPKDEFDRVYNQKFAVAADRRTMQNYFVWRSLVEQESYHAGKMLADETLKGYISTSKAVQVAKGFAGRGLAGGAIAWVYVTRIKGGFVIPDKGKHAWTQLFGEQEIALPAGLPWEEIFGFRQMKAGENMFAGPIYLRRGFQASNLAAFQEVHRLLSGKKQ